MFYVSNMYQELMFVSIPDTESAKCVLNSLALPFVLLRTSFNYSVWHFHGTYLRALRGAMTVSNTR
jgi:hypothetical protein